MRKSEFSIEMSSKVINSIKKIAKAECLDVNISIKENALGDTVVVVYGSTEDIKNLRAIYNMVA